MTPLPVIKLIEYTSVLCSLVSLYADIKQHLSARFFALFSSFFSLYVLYSETLYGSCLLVMLMIGLHSYGIYVWVGVTPTQTKPTITRVKKKTCYGMVTIGSLSAYLLSFFLSYIGQKNFSALDGWNAIFSLIATWLLVQKKLETWILWIVISISYFFVFLKLNLYGFALLQIIYLILNFWGNYTWQKDYCKL